MTATVTNVSAEDVAGTTVVSASVRESFCKEVIEWQRKTWQPKPS
jgi:hypothetical protein